MKLFIVTPPLNTAFLRRLTACLLVASSCGASLASGPAQFAVTSKTAIVITGTSKAKSQPPASFVATASSPIVIVGSQQTPTQTKPASFTTSSPAAMTIIGNKKPSSTEGQAKDYPPPASFTASATTPIIIRGVVPTPQETPASFMTTSENPIVIVGQRQKTSTSPRPASFMTTSIDAIHLVGAGSSENASEIESTNNKNVQLPNANSVTGKPSKTTANNGNRQAPTTTRLDFIPLVSLVQVTPLDYRGNLVQPFEPDTVVSQIDERIAERRDAVTNGTSSGGDRGGNTGGGNSGGGFMAESLAVNGSLPISSTDGQINLDYQPSSGMRSLRVFNEDSTSPMPIRRVLTTSGVSAGAVQINIDDDYFAVHSRVPASDVISAPGGQTIIVRDYTDNSYLQIQITVGSANFFGDHTVENIVGWYCGADPADCPL